MPTNPVEVEKYLKGVDYPAKKQDLMKRAEENRAPREIVEALKRMPEEMFQKPTDVTRAISQMR